MYRGIFQPNSMGVAKLVLWLLVSAGVSTVSPEVRSQCESYAFKGARSLVSSKAEENAAISELVSTLETDLSEQRFAAAVVVLLEGDQLRACGFGKENMAADTPLEMNRSRFFIGSISKTFTGLAVAQLLETGQLESVDDPVNKYLQRLQMPDWGQRPITLRDLLTHSAGFEDQSAFVGTLQGAALPLSKKYIVDRAPKQVRAPGQLTSYSNYSTALLGIMVEDVSGQLIQDYFDAHTWTPLGMASADFATDLMRPIDTVVAARKGSDNGLQEVPFLAFDPLYWPVGAIVATPLDMGRYLRAQLRQGVGPDQGSVGGRVFKKLQSPLFGNHPEVNNFAMKLMRGRWGEHQFLVHGGSWPSYNSMLKVFPKEGKGYYISVVSLHGTGNGLDIVELDRRVSTLLFGEELLAAVDQPDSVQLAQYAGRYRINKRNITGHETILGYLGGRLGVTEVTVAESGEGLLINDKGPFHWGGEDWFYDADFEFDPGDAFAGKRYGFVRDSGGVVVALSDDFGLWSSSRVSGLADPQVQRQFVIYAVVVLLLSLLLPFWPALARGERLPRVCAVLIPLSLVAQGAILLQGHDAGGLGYYLLRGETLRFNLMSLLGSVIGLITLWLGFNLKQLVAAGGGLTVMRLLRIAHQALVIVAAMVVFVFLYHVNLAFHWH